MVLEIIECVFKVSKLIYETVDDVQANKKRCQRLSDRVRCLVTPLNELVKQGDNNAVYKEALIDLVRTLEEARQFLKTFTKEKSVLRRLHDACYANRVKETFECLNDRLNNLVPALTLGLQVECRKSVQRTFSVTTRLAEDTKDESNDLKQIQQLVNAFGLPSFHCIRSSDLKEKKFHSDSELYTHYTAKYRFNRVVLKKPKFALTSERKDLFLTDARNMLQFNSESVVRVYGLCVDVRDSYIIVTEYMKFDGLDQLLGSSEPVLDEKILSRMMVETARGLYFVHCCEAVHGSLSLRSYLVNEDLHVKISGFEFSRTEPKGLEAEPSRCQITQGCCKGQNACPRSDIHCYGMVLLSILTHLAGCYRRVDAAECYHLLTDLNVDHRPLDVAKSCLTSDSMACPTMEEVVVQLTSYFETLGDAD